MRVGTTCTLHSAVTESNPAAAVGSGDMNVLATPAMAALMEQAAMRAVADSLPEGSTTVGCRLDISHIRATVEGRAFCATAEVTAIEGRSITFALQASDDKGIIGEGTHIRVIVDRKRFMDKALQ